MQAYDAVVVGAGPYGLSTAAHLRGRGLRVAVFGRTMEMWRRHMPKGMLLRSHWWATNLSDPRNEFSFEQYCRESQQDKAYPVPIQTFIDYGAWFQQRAVPEVDDTYVASIQREGQAFLLTLADGREVRSQAVVMAIGLRYYANRPEPYDELPEGLVSHTSEHGDFGPFKGRRVVVIGGAQSAIESAALLIEAGATVDVVSRRPIMWLAPERQRGILERLRAPDAKIAPGWQNWVLDHLPFLFYRFPQPKKDHYNSYYMAGATHWLRGRVIDRATLHEGQTVAKIEPVDGHVEVTVSDGTTVRADHILLGTGYRVNIDRVTMLDPSLRAEIETDGGFPVLSHWFEASVPGLYFVGITSLRAFGPLYRFVAGCGAAASRVAAGVARARARQPEPAATRPGRVRDPLSES
jgi:thioredoxin reductase